MNKRQIGTEGEHMAARYLQSEGYAILEMNYRCKLGEIDIIASKKDCMTFVEVKYRKNDRYGTSLEAVNHKKQQIIRRVASFYLVSVIHSANVHCSFDVIGIDGSEITHLKNAF